VGAYRRVDRDLSVSLQYAARMSGRDLVMTRLCHADVGWLYWINPFALLSCSAETWTSAPPQRVAR
jgi:hypothetical protein